MRRQQVPDGDLLPISSTSPVNIVQDVKRYDTVVESAAVELGEC